MVIMRILAVIQADTRLRRDKKEFIKKKTKKKTPCYAYNTRQMNGM